MPLGCYACWEHFFLGNLLSEVPATSPLESHGGLWWLERKWGSGSALEPHPAFRILASPHLPGGFVLENSTCFPWNKGFWKAGRPSWQRPVWSRAQAVKFQKPHRCASAGEARGGPAQDPGGQARDVRPYTCLAGQGPSQELQGLTNYEQPLWPKGYRSDLALLGTHIFLDVCSSFAKWNQ